MTAHSDLTDSDGTNDGVTAPSVRSAVLHLDLHRQPPPVVQATGHHYTLGTGQKIYDATGGTGVACLGHGDKRVIAAIATQMRNVSYYHTFSFSNPTVEKCAEELINSTHGQMARALMLSSGSEAIEAAIKLARQYFMELSVPQPKRVNFIARQDSYHGATIAALSLGGYGRTPFEPLLLNSNISRVSACNSYRGMLEGESTKEYVDRLAKELDEEFWRAGPETV